MSLNLSIKHNITLFFPAVLVPITIMTWDNGCMFLMMMEPCTDLMGSGSLILTMISVVSGALASVLCLQLVRTTVPGVSYQLSVLRYFVKISSIQKI